VYAKRQSAEKPAIGGCVGLKDPLWLEAAGNSISDGSRSTI
jgi:hypothetical protein